MAQRFGAPTLRRTFGVPGPGIVRQPAFSADFDAQCAFAEPRARPIPGTRSLRRLRVAATRRRLDRQLAEGADPAGSPSLALRARQLTSRRHREMIADSLDQLVRAAERPPRWGSAVSPVRGSIDAARTELAQISEALRSPVPAYARGVALSEALVHDGQSPLYGAFEAASAWYWARLAILALKGLP